MADDELEAIQAIYCRPGEICIIHGGDGSKEVKVRLKPDVSPDCQDEAPLQPDAELCLSLPSTYPSRPPDISVRSNSLPRKDISRLRTMLCENAARNLDQPMLLELITSASDELHKMMEDGKGDAQTVGEGCDNVEWVQGQYVHSVGSEGQGRLALLHLDHMRAKAPYVRVIRKWAAELGLNGCLLFCQRLILIVLQGSSSAIKDYIVRQRTNTVDVDSRGQPCKERMLSVLCDIPVAPHHSRFDDFRVVELSMADELKQFFTRWCLQDVFLEYVTTLKHFPGR